VAWTDVPDAVRAAVDNVAGSPVARATNVNGGFSPGPAARCDLADGSTVFVKAAGIALNPVSPAMHRREAEILAAVPRPFPAPELIGVVDDGDWVALVVEWIDGTMPGLPFADPADVARLLQLVTDLADAGAGVRIAGVRPINTHARDTPDGQSWCRIPRDGTIDRLDPWCARHLDELVELEAGWREAAAGDTLQHHDLRADNVLFCPDGTAVAVDWPGATYAAPWVDLAGLLPSLHLDGGPAPWDVFDAHTLGRRADPTAVDAYIASMAGYLVRSSLLPAPPGLPTVRAFQAAQGVVTCEWLARRRPWA
jgi:aminoglycoside phosphotransferase (APT) family kinase protein